jgi:Trk-type K+ transport system membrane component
MAEEKVAEGQRRKGITATEVEFALSVALVLLGIAFYLWYVLILSPGRWWDNGAYAVTITLLGFGLAGMLVTAPRPVQKPTH